MVGSTDEADPTPWREVRPAIAGGARPPSAWVGAAIGAAVVALLVWQDHVPAAVVLATVVVGLVVVRRVSPRADRAVARVLVSVGHVVGVALTWLMMGLVALVFVVPVWALTRLLRWNPLEPEPRHGRWALRVRRSWESMPHRGFANERRSLPRASRLHGLAVTAVPLVVLVLLAFPFRSQTTRAADRILPDWVVGGSSAPGTGPATEVVAPIETIPEPHGDGPDGNPRDGRLALGDAPWLAQYIGEYFPVPLLYDSHLTVRLADNPGQFVTVRSRVRDSYVPAGAGDDPAALDVWFFGSSALFGQGQRNEHTIPSEVARLAESQGLVLRVQNFGVPGYRAWQDDLALAQLLTEREAPDLIVMYQGFNDIMATIGPGSRTEVDAGWADDVRRALHESDAEIGGTTDADDPTPRTSGTSPQNSAIVFGRAARFARAIAGAWGVPLAQYLQPSLWTRDLAVDDATLANVGADREWHDSFAIGWNEARRLMATDGVVDLGDSLDDLDELVYSDLAHHNERAAQVVAEDLYAHLEPELARLAGEKVAAGQG